MLFRLFLAFSLIPLMEIYLLIKAGSFIGAEATILIVLVTGFVGAWLAKMQGASTMNRIRSNMQQGIAPASELVDAFLIFAAGLVLLTPGFVTDAVGICLLIPPIRESLKRRVKKKFEDAVRNGNVHVVHYR
jgi:UPF0716 protein FxsA